MSTVERSKVVTVMLVLATVLALSATAATIDSTTPGAGGDSQLNFRPGGDLNESEGAGGGANNQNPGGGLEGADRGVSLSMCVELLTGPIAILGVLAGVVAVLGLVYYRYNASTAVLVGSGIVPLVMGSYFLLTNCASQYGGATGGGPSINPNDPSLAQPPSVPPGLLAIGLVGIVAAAIAVLYSATGRDEEFEPLAEEEEIDDLEAADFADAAGRAADRIERANVPVDNAVYRAWLEMTTMLDLPNPKASAPLDFAEAAVEFGLDEDDVTELTELFNEVRYGHRDPASREERALEILRHIEETYGETASGQADKSGSGGGS